jgi:hypothetical protein
MSLFKLILALIAVESGGDLAAVGDNGKALGCLQLHAIYVEDVNRIYKTSYKHEDAYDMNKATDIAVKYLMHYGKVYENKTGHEATYEVLARIHNGGPNGWKKKATLKYWQKVKKELN